MSFAAWAATVDSPCASRTVTMYFSRPSSTTVSSALAAAPGTHVAPRSLAARAASRCRRTGAAALSICAASLACTAESNAIQATDFPASPPQPRPSSLFAVQAAAAKPAASTAGRGVGEAGLDVVATGPAVQAAATTITAVRTTGVHDECARPEAGPRGDCRPIAPQNTPRIRSRVISFRPGRQPGPGVGRRSSNGQTPAGRKCYSRPEVGGIVTGGTRELRPIGTWSWTQSFGPG